MGEIDEVASQAEDDYYINLFIFCLSKKRIKKGHFLAGISALQNHS